MTLNRAPGRQVTVEYAAATNPGTASSGTDYTAFAGDTLTIAANATASVGAVTVTAADDSSRRERGMAACFFRRLLTLCLT